MLYKASGFLCVHQHHLLILPQIWNSLCWLKTELVSVKAAEVLLIFGLNAVITCLGFVVLVWEKNNKIPCTSLTLPYLPVFRYIQNLIVFPLTLLPLWSIFKNPTNISSPSWMISVTTQLAALFPPLPHFILIPEARGSS